MKSAENNCGEGRNGSASPAHQTRKSPYPQIRIRACVPQERQTLRQELVYTVFARKIPITELAPNFSNSRFMSVKLIPVVRISSISKTSRPSM